MTENELKKLSRSDLLQLLVDQGKELRELKEKYEKAQAELADRQIKIDNAGSIAEASLQLNGVFEAAQEACRQYTDNIMNLSARQEAICARMEAESSLKAKMMIEQAEEKSAKLISEAETKSQLYWENVYEKMQAYSAEHAELKALFAQSVSGAQGDK